MFDASRVAVVETDASSYSEAPFHPDRIYPELSSVSVASFTNLVFEGVRQLFVELGLDLAHYGTKRWNPLGGLVCPGNRVLIKPNLVLDFNAQGHALEAIVTPAAVLRPIIDYVLLALRGEGEVVIGDSSHGNCDFSALLERNGLARLLDYYTERRAPVRLADLRKYVYGCGPNGFVQEVRRLQDGDPLGYVEVDLGRDSSLWGLSHLERLYSTDWDRSFIRERHCANTHRYLVAGTALNADVVVGVPKLKTHSKVGITVNLKNLVGIIGDKNWLAHYRIGDPSEGGDEYPPFASHWQRFLARTERGMQDLFLAPNTRSGRHFYRAAQWSYRFLRASTVSRADRDASFGPGNWYGNDTAWRMALDLNRILRFADAKGMLHEQPQRRFFSVVDGIIAGEGDGPLGARAKPCGILLAGCDAAAVDFVAASLMGFAPDDIPIVREAFTPTRLRVASGQRGNISIVSPRPTWQGKAPIAGLCEHLDFLPPRGWLPVLARGRRSNYVA